MKKFNLIGLNTADSLSPYIHNFVFDQMGIKAKYSSMNIERVSDIKEIAKKIKSGLIEGVNVTNPYKISAIKYIDMLDISAKKLERLIAFLFGMVISVGIILIGLGLRK